MKPNDMIKIKNGDHELEVTRKAFNAFYSYNGYEEVKTRRSTKKVEVKEEE